MKIGIDMRTMEGGAQHRGIGRYATQLIEALSKIDHSNEYTFITTSDDAQLPNFNLAKGFRYKYHALNRKYIRQLKYIRILFVTRKPENIDHLKLDTVLQLDITYPLAHKATPTVSVLYDLIPLIFKEQYQKVVLQRKTPQHILAYIRQKAFWYFTNRHNHQYESAKRIVSISEHSGKDLVRLYPRVRKDAIRVTPLAATKLPPPTGQTKKSYKKMSLKEGEFVLYIGGLDPRKGLTQLVKDFAEARKTLPDLRLVLGGKEFNGKIPESIRLNELIKTLGIEGFVIQCHDLSDELMGILYKNAAVSVLPSRYEGFGLPVLDAMQANCPCICYDNSSLPEVADRAALVLKDGSRLDEAIIRVCTDKNFANELRNRGREQAKKFSWEKTARLTLKTLEESTK